MPHTLIMPKQTGQQDAFYESLRLLYESHRRGEEWYSNTDFKREIKIALPYLAKGAQDGPYLVKQSELTRYFGFVFYDYSTAIGRSHITDAGIKFFEAYLRNDIEAQIEMLMNSIFTISFGRDNTAIEHSDSDVDAPKLFIKAMFDLGGISRKDLAYLLYVTHDKQVSYKDALKEFQSAVGEREINIPENVRNKYSDVKFTVLLTAFGICEDNANVYSLSDFIKTKYRHQIEQLSIYNKEPEVILSLDEELEEDNDANVSDLTLDEELQQKILTSFVYDVNSEKFKRQNNRKPIPAKAGHGNRYKTNPRISKTALALAECKCQCHPDEHITFLSKLGQQYMEAHHLIPMCAQKDFDVNLDRIENIVSICPICHSAIHLGADSVRLEILKTLYDMKIDGLKEAGLDISFGDLYTKYYK
ncbi:MAG: hypothetical protein ACLRFF_01165 [Alphaproteobacteria bacterium]